MNEQAERRAAPAAYPIIKIVSWVVMALAILSIGYIAFTSFVNWDAIRV